jgi:hypothetical protein
VKVRNQSVMIKGVNDSADADPSSCGASRLHERAAVLRLPARHGQRRRRSPHQRQDTVELERQVRGATAGFNTPTFVNDVPGGGGKRDVHSFEHYDETPASASTAARASMRRRSISISTRFTFCLTKGSDDGPTSGSTNGSSAMRSGQRA